MILEILAVAFSTGILILASVLPYIALKREHESPRHRSKSNLSGLSICNCFACGIFLGTCFIGLMPHISMQESKILQHLNVTNPHTNNEYPYLRSNVIILAGFVLILLIEQIAFICTPKHRQVQLGDAHFSNGNANHQTIHVQNELNQPLVDLDSDSENELEEIQFRGLEHDDDEHHHEHGHHHHHVMPGEGNSIEYILLLIALSVHSVFEGIALGAQKNFIDFMKFLLSIMIHEVLCSFAYGVSLSKHKIPLKKAIGSILFLSFSLPLGLLIMVCIGSSEALTSLIIKFILEGLAAGIFIYVATIEMLSSEIPHQPEKSGFIKSLFIGFGVVVFFFINLLLS